MAFRRCGGRPEGGVLGVRPRRLRAPRRGAAEAARRALPAAGAEWRQAVGSERAE